MNDVEPSTKLESETPPQPVEKRKKKRRDRRKTNSSESSPTNPFKVEPAAQEGAEVEEVEVEEEREREDPEELSGSENVNQKPRVVVPSPPGTTYFSLARGFYPDISPMHCQSMTVHWTIVKYFSLLE